MKLVIVINGKGGVGKDTICGILGAHYRALSVSSVAPIKEIARMHGWEGGKEDRDRKFLSDLKYAFSTYNDLPYRYMMGELEKFLSSDAEVVCFHIRETPEIAKFVAGAEKLAGARAMVRTLLVRRSSVDGRTYGNVADDGVGDYAYDWTFDNDGPLDCLGRDFMGEFSKWLSE